MRIVKCRVLEKLERGQFAQTDISYGLLCLLGLYDTGRQSFAPLHYLELAGGWIQCLG
jgi:hypothetical protein